MPSITPAELQRIRETLAGERGPRYWRSLEELSHTAGFAQLIREEFPRLEALWQAPMSRRDALRLMAASMALAGLAGCSGQPPEYLVPYVHMPEGLLPGEARYYATAAVVGGYAHGLLAESHEGRPTKVEGNPDHPATRGACDSFAQASVLSLYDPDRADAVRHAGAVASYSRLLDDLAARQGEWDKSAGRGLAVLTATLASPSARARLAALRKRWPEARWYVHEPVGREAVHEASAWLFGEPLEPVYRFDRARVVVSLDADFLFAQPGFLRYARDFMGQRRPRDVDTALARLYAVESTPTVTGSVADHRRALAYPRVEAAARQLARALGVEVAAGEAALAPAWVEAVAADLRGHRGAALVVPGEQQPAAVQAIAHAINQALGAYGKTLTFIEPVAGHHRGRGVAELTAAMRAGEVTSLVSLEANPVYSAPADLEFDDAYQTVPWRLHFSEYFDETARHAHWHVPAAHPLEAWADAEAYDGTASLIQPLIRPLQGGRTALTLLDSLMTGVEGEDHALLRDYWRQHHGGADFQDFWRRSLHDGVVANTAAPPRSVALRGDWSSRLPAPPERGGGGQESAVTLQFHPDPAVWDGRYANNGWLQELPSPQTKLTWGNAALIPPALAARLEVGEGDVVRLSAAGGELTLPVYVLPGQPENTVSVALGYGRSAGGRIAEGVGANAYRLRTSGAPWAMPARLEATDERRTLAVTQHHHRIEGRDLLREADLRRYRDEPDFARRESRYGSGEPPSLYPEPWPAKRGAQHAWGMVVDLSACIGCSFCVIACQAENNIPIVGPEQTARGQDMHWIRVDRYFEGPIEGPRMVFQPVPCMHCENAPCEYVCPVEATQHSAAGLNEMIYQRCVGTRYCSQNCPYKVRRFNWFDYTGEGAAHRVQPAVHNPDVTVRSGGVMEKCTYCVQRINAARIAADNHNRPIRDGELQTACQQACPTEAIVFGDIDDEASEVRRLKDHPLNYAMLEELNTRPRTTYLAAVRNPNPDLGGGGEDERHG